MVNLHTLTQFDVFAKVDSVATQRSLTGALASVLCVAFVAFLIASEVSTYSEVRMTDRFEVDTQPVPILPLQLDMSFHNMGCWEMELKFLDGKRFTESVVQRSTLMMQELVKDVPTGVEWAWESDDEAELRRDPPEAPPTPAAPAAQSSLLS